MMRMTRLGGCPSGSSGVASTGLGRIIDTSVVQHLMLASTEFDTLVPHVIHQSLFGPPVLNLISHHFFDKCRKRFDNILCRLRVHMMYGHEKVFGRCET